jgi:TPP-dependent pyruvate/acetoin dehydrogenase alpha subunit
LIDHQENTASMAGSANASLIEDAKLKQLYATMLQCRLLIQHAGSLRNQPQGKALYSVSMGQEAIATGCAIDLRPQDTIALAAHDSIPALVKGVALSTIVARLYKRRSSATHNVISLPSNSGEQFQAATRVALANKQKNNTNVVVAFTAAAATARSGWHDALKLSAKRSLPIIFVVENNPWTTVAGYQERNGREHPALKTQIKGLTAIAVDGNDVVAVYRVAYESLERVRQGGGPVLIEGKTYRQDGQALSHIERDPLTHMERYLKAKKLFTARWKNQLVHRFTRELDAAVRQIEVPVKTARYLPASQPLQTIDR